MHKAQISFLGDDAAEHHEMSRFIQHEASKIPHAVVKVYASPRDTKGMLQWDLTISSPSGRQSFSVIQRTPSSKIYVRGD